MENYQVLTNLGHYEAAASFTNLLAILRITANQVTHLRNDGFSTLKDMVEYFERSSGSQIKKYFEKINSTFESSPK